MKQDRPRSSHPNQPQPQFSTPVAACVRSDSGMRSGGREAPGEFSFPPSAGVGHTTPTYDPPGNDLAFRQRALRVLSAKLSHMQTAPWGSLGITI